jgi:O-antigen ligase
MPPPATATPSPDASGPAALLSASLLAAVVPTLLAYHQPPSATLLNQCLAVALWGGWVMVIAPRRLARSTWPLLAALALVALAAAGSWLWGTLPRSLSWQALGLLAGAMLMVVAGADAARRPWRTEVFAALAWGLLASGVLSSGVALVQVFAPGWADGDWIAHSGVAGRAVGNLRQPNHLCSLLLWALVAAVALYELRRLPRAALLALAPLLVLAVELSASRTGAVGLGLLLAWGLVDRRLSRTARVWLIAMPLLYALAWAAMAWWGDYSQQALGAGARVAAEGLAADSPNARPNIWRNALALIEANPWTGVGFGEFNFAWSLTAFAHRPTAFFDHTHNLPLQLMVELGLPLSGAVMALLGLALWQAGRRASRAQGDAAVVARAALVLVLLIGLHSLVEYPLWYAYFLLPAALAWGLVLGLPESPSDDPAPRNRTHTAAWRTTVGAAAGLLMAAGGVLALLDYQRVVVIYAPTDDSGPLAARIARGQLSPLFAHHADYAAATNETPPASTALGLARATHSLLDTRLMIAWARHLAASGHVDEARWVAQRLRDFRNPDAAEFFAPCEAGETRAFQCQPPQAVHDWRALATLPPLLAPAAAADQPAAASSARQ